MRIGPYIKVIVTKTRNIKFLFGLIDSLEAVQRDHLFRVAFLSDPYIENGKRFLLKIGTQAW